jgi:hypothetical protein
MPQTSFTALGHNLRRVLAWLRLLLRLILNTWMRLARRPGLAQIGV